MFNDNFDTYLYEEVKNYLLECGFDYLSIDHYMKPTPESNHYIKATSVNIINFRGNTPLVSCIKEFFQKFYGIKGKTFSNWYCFETVLSFEFSKKSANNIRILAKMKNN